LPDPARGYAGGMWDPESGRETSSNDESVADRPNPTDERDEKADTAAEPARDFRGTGIMWGAVALVAVAVLFVVVALQNAHDVEFDFLWATVQTPLILIIAITIAVTLVVDEVVGFLWRRRRRTRLREREELRSLRKKR
jgi:uncharacterized integral membrane protein